MLRVFVADDHPVFRHGLKDIIDETTDIRVVDEASDGLSAIEKTRHEHFDAVILDISMPGKDGLEVLREIKQEQPGTPVLILSMHPEDQYAVHALRAGASGYLTKDSPPEELIVAIRRISAGGRYISSTLAEHLADYIQLDGKRAAANNLSQREDQVARLFASGKTASEIATELSLSVKTVSTHRARILDKLGVKNNAELTRYAMKNGMVD
jgi:two-component system invasion response regulator UvrY